MREVKEELSYDLHHFRLFRTIVENTPDEIVKRRIYWGNISEKAEDLRIGEGVGLKYLATEEIPSIRVAFDLKPVTTDFMKTHVPRRQKK